METIQINGLDVYYKVVGEGRPIIFLHGNPADHRSMMSAFEPLFAERTGWQRIYFDLPGMGKTKGADWIESMDHMLEVVLGLIDTLISNKRFLVVGESYGGYMARGVAHFKPDLIDGMFLIAPSVKPGAPDRQIPEKRIIHADVDFVVSLRPELQQALGEVATVHTREIGARLMTDYISAMQMSDQAFLRRVHETNSFSFDLNNPPPRYEFPALIIAGRQDIIVGYADQIELHKFFPRGSVVVLDRAGHVTELEQPILFNALTNEWLDRVEEALSVEPDKV
ncbi:MAG: alpha/beta hydrolase [Chloroflexota bacterium]